MVQLHLLRSTVGDVFGSEPYHLLHIRSAILFVCNRTVVANISSDVSTNTVVAGISSGVYAQSTVFNSQNDWNLLQLLLLQAQVTLEERKIK